MKVEVERRSNGRIAFFRLSWDSGHWQNIEGNIWDRKMASKALDLLERVHGLKRRLVRFEHH